MEFSISFGVTDPLAPKTCFENYSSSHSVVVIEATGLFFVLNALVFLSSASLIFYLSMSSHPPVYPLNFLPMCNYGQFNHVIGVS